jgi:hypothetical protein
MFISMRRETILRTRQRALRGMRRVGWLVGRKSATGRRAE